MKSFRQSDHDRLPHSVIYGNEEHARKYERLMSHHDAGTRSLPAALDGLAIFDRASTRVVELGCGTGRLTLMLAERGAALHALDSAPAMLAVARARLEEAQPSCTYELSVADHRALTPVASGWADVVVAGWSLNYLHSTAWAGDWPVRCPRVCSAM